MLRHACALAAAAAAAAAVPTVAVYKSYQPGQPECYRQPILVAAGAPGTLLAFAEGRNINNYSFCAGTEYPDVADFPIVVRRSTDFGATWGASSTTIMQGNLDFLTAAYDASTSTVHLMVQLGDDGVVYSASRDAGATWSAPVNVSVPPGSYASIIPGVGRGLVIDPSRCLDPTCAGTAGRILMPWACTVNGPVSNDTACGNCRSCLLLSDDQGASWRLGAVSNNSGSRESALVQLDSAAWYAMGAVVYANERNLGAVPGVRLEDVSTDGGASFAPSRAGVARGLPDVDTGNWTGVVAGLTRVRGSGGGGGDDFLFFTAPAAQATRANLTAFVSSGVAPGFTWAPSPLGTIYADAAAYSDALQINSTHVGLLFECGSGGDFAAQIAFAAVSISQLRVD